jgi:hypothetical protein
VDSLNNIHYLNFLHFYSMVSKVICTIMTFHLFYFFYFLFKKGNVGHFLGCYYYYYYLKKKLANIGKGGIGIKTTKNMWLPSNILKIPFNPTQTLNARDVNMSMTLKIPLNLSPK